MIAFTSSFLLPLTAHTLRLMSKGLVSGESWFGLTTIPIVSALLCVILVTERQRQDRASGNQVQQEGDGRRERLRWRAEKVEAGMLISRCFSTEVSGTGTSCGTHTHKHAQRDNISSSRGRASWRLKLLYCPRNRGMEFTDRHDRFLITVKGLRWFITTLALFLKLCHSVLLVTLRFEITEGPSSQSTRFQTRQQFNHIIWNALLEEKRCTHTDTVTHFNSPITI